MAVSITFRAIARDQLIAADLPCSLCQSWFTLSVQSSLDEMGARLSEKTHKLNSLQLDNDRFKVRPQIFLLAFWPDGSTGLISRDYCGLEIIVPALCVGETWGGLYFIVSARVNWFASLSSSRLRLTCWKENWKQLRIHHTPRLVR